MIPAWLAQVAEAYPDAEAVALNMRAKVGEIVATLQVGAYIVEIVFDGGRLYSVAAIGQDGTRSTIDAEGVDVLPKVVARVVELAREFDAMMEKTEARRCTP